MEIESPLWYVYVTLALIILICFSTYIYFSEDTRANRVYMPIYIGSVPTESLEGFAAKLKDSFKTIIADGIDMERMAMVINREERQVGSHMYMHSFLKLTHVSFAVNSNQPRVTHSLAP